MTRRCSRGAITRGVAGLGKEFVTLSSCSPAVMIYEDWQLALISVLLLPPVAWVTQRLSRSLRKSSTRGMEETGTLSRALSEALAGRRIVKAYRSKPMRRSRPSRASPNV